MNKNQAFNRFVKTISHPNISELIRVKALESWLNIDFTCNEVEIVRKYLMDKNVGIHYLDNELCKNLNIPYEIKFSSVFVHQKPRVKRDKASIKKCKGDSKSCELGDLLVLFCFLDKNKIPIIKTAHLMQAKKKYKLDSQSQRCLYEVDEIFHMPDVVLKQSSVKNESKRFLPNYMNGDRNKALSYLILNNKIPVSVDIPFLPLKSKKCWGDFIFSVFQCGTGLKFENPNYSLNLGWNLIIEDLINVGKGTVKSSKKRGDIDDLINYFNDFKNYEKFSIEDEDSNGIPIMMIIVKDLEYGVDTKTDVLLI